MLPSKVSHPLDREPEQGDPSACAVLAQRGPESWLWGIDQAAWLALTEQRLKFLQTYTSNGVYPRLLLVETDPLAFLASWMAACLSECPVFIGNPTWRRSEWQQVLSLVQPHLIWPTDNALGATLCPDPPLPQQQGWLMIPTGGSSGQIRFAIHTWATLSAAVRGCQDHFFSGAAARSPINSCCVLPLYHVSGLMQFMRSLITGGQFLLLPKQALESGVSQDKVLAAFLDPQSPQPQTYFLSLVPTQLQRLLSLDQPGTGNRHRISWLAQFPAILLGGAPPWPTLLEQARQYQLRLALTYGMTETAAQVATLNPDQFLLGDRSNGRPLPHVQITIIGDQPQPLATEQIGKIVIKGASVCLGYYPQVFAEPGRLLTDDLGYFSDPGHLWIVGRSHRTIITGGETVYPEEIEAALRATGQVSDVYVIGLPDPEWGERITAVWVAATSTVTPSTIKTALQDHLSPIKHPKQWIRLDHLPRTPPGKIDQTLLQSLIQPYL